MNWLSTAWNSIGSLLFPSVANVNGYHIMRQEIAQLQELVQANPLPVVVTPTANNITGETDLIRKQYRRALSEPTVYSSLLVRLFGVSSQPVRILPASDEPRDQAIADFVRWTFEHLGGGTRELIHDMLLPGSIDGYSVGEKLWRVVDRGRYRGMRQFYRLKSKDTNQLQLEIDQFNNVTGVRPTRNSLTAALLDPKFFVIFSHLKIFENPHGLSSLRAIVDAVDYKRVAITLRMRCLEKFTGPFLVGKYTDADKRAYLLETLRQARAAGVIAMPKDNDIQVVDLAMSGTQDFAAMIDYCDKQIAMALHGSYLHMMEGTVNNARGSSDNAMSISGLFTQDVATAVTDVINTQLIPDIVDSNFVDSPEYPTAVVGTVDISQLKAELDLDQGLLDAGMKLSRADMHKRYGRLGPRDAEDELSKSTPSPVQVTVPADVPAPHVDDNAA